MEFYCFFVAILYGTIYVKLGRVIIATGNNLFIIVSVYCVVGGKMFCFLHNLM